MSNITLKELIALKKQVNSEQVENLMDDLRLAFDHTPGFDRLPMFISAAYILYLLGKNKVGRMEDFSKLREMFSEDEDIEYFIGEQIEKVWKNVEKLNNKYANSTLLSFILFYNKNNAGRNSNSSTPSSLIALAVEVLKIKDTDLVADFGTGMGSFIVDAYLYNSEALYYGNEINTTSKAVAYIRAKLISDSITIRQSDMFLENNDKKFDKIFSNYPFGQKTNELYAGKELFEKLKDIALGKSKVVSSDWLYNYFIISKLKVKGKAVAITTMGSTFNSLDKGVREYFIQEGLIEAIIALPGRLFDYTAIETAMVILSMGNKKIRMVDATEICKIGRRKVEFTSVHIKKIAQALKKDSNFSKEVTVKAIEANDFVLNPKRYLTIDVDIKNGVAFKDIVKNVTRGAQLRAVELDDLVSTKPTTNQYLMLSNIQNGFIDENLPYLKEINKSQKKYCLKDKDLLLSKNGAPFKVAIAQVKDDKKILANGNLYIVELDLTKVNPYYVKAYLESEDGIRTLSKVVVGATIPNITLSGLNSIKIPLLSMKEQNYIAEKYLAKVDEISLLKAKLEKATNDLKMIITKEE